MSYTAEEHDLYTEFFERCREQLVEILGVRTGEKVWNEGGRIFDLSHRSEWYTNIFKSLGGDYSGLKDQTKFRFSTKPVSIEEFVKDPYFLDSAGSVWPNVMKELSAIQNGENEEVVMTGSIGCAKTHIAVYLLAYQVYLLSLYRNPHKEFDLDPSSEIQIIFQSVKEALAKEVGYTRFQSLLSEARYFQEHFPYDPNIKSKMVFPNRVEVKYVSGAATATLGSNVLGGAIDEVNFMEITEDSSKAADGGIYDQAMALYESVARRRKSRFMQGGEKLPGILCLMSSARYPGQFTDQKIAESKKPGSRIYVYDHTTWTIRPEKYTKSKWFKIFIGDAFRKPRILKPDEILSEEDQEMVRDIPEDYRTEFERDIYSSLRDIAGVSTRAKNPFMPNSERVSACFGRRRSVVPQQTVDFVSQRPQIVLSRIKHRNLYRFIHIDLGLTGDAAGLSCGYVEKFVRIKRRETTEVLPKINLDFCLRIVPPANGEIEFANIRNLIYALRDNGVPIRWVTCDSWQSTDTVQILRAKGFITGVQSIDKTPLPYDMTKTALYDGRVNAPEHAMALSEFTSLELEVKAQKVKIDHPSSGEITSKDVADSIAGVVYGVTTRRETWTTHGVSGELPRFVEEQLTKVESAKAGLDGRS